MLSGASKAPVGLEQHVTAIATPVGYALVARGRRPVPQAANYRWISFHCSFCRSAGMDRRGICRSPSGYPVRQGTVRVGRGCSG